MKKYLPLWAALSLLPLVSCGQHQAETYSGLAVLGRAYVGGESTLSVGFTPTMEHLSAFKDSLAKEDVTVCYLDGTTAKTVSSVSINDGTMNVTITGDGDATKVENGIAKAYLEVRSTAVMDGNNYRGYFDLFTPTMTVPSGSYMKISATAVMASSRFVLPYGSFKDNPESYVSLPDDNGMFRKIEKSSDTELYVSVEDYTPSEKYPNPIIKIAAAGTTFNKDLYVYLGVVLPTEDVGYPLM